MSSSIFYSNFHFRFFYENALFIAVLNNKFCNKNPNKILVNKYNAVGYIPTNRLINLYTIYALYPIA